MSGRHRSARRSPSPMNLGNRRRTAMSPTRLSRIQEKEELQHCNDRLAVLIDAIRHDAAENDKLSLTLQATTEVITQEKASIRNVYERELSGIREALGETENEKAKLELVVDKLETDVSELAEKLSKKTRESAKAEKHRQTLEILKEELQKQINQLNPEKRKLETLLKESESENHFLTQQLATARQDAQKETLSRIDLENRLKNMKDEFVFKESVFQKEIKETLILKETELQQIDTKLRKDYEQKLAGSLLDLRKEYETQIKINRDDIESNYETKIVNYQDKLDKASAAVTKFRDELRTVKTEMEMINAENSNSGSIIASLESRIKSLENLRDQERDMHSDALKSKDEELAKLRKEMDERIREYEQLLDLNVDIAMEISTYNKLLEGEESKFVTSTPEAVSTPSKAAKRKRTVVFEGESSSKKVHVSGQSKGDIQISDQDLSGKYIKIFNKGFSEVSLAGWQLHQHADDQTVKFKFPRGTSIKPQMTITIWSSDSGVTPSPPQNYLLRNLSWFSSNSLVSSLVNVAGLEMASKKSIRVV